MATTVESDAVLFDVEDGVATITINNADMRNALTREVSAGLLEALDAAEEADDARCLVIQGAGGAFSAGGDITNMKKRMSGEVPLEQSVEDIILKTSRAIKRVHQFYLPTIAKIDGPAFGAGANLAVACDIQLASSESQISFGFRQVGLAVDTGTSYFLPRIVGLNTAKELVYTGELVDAARAEDLGLFNHVYDAASFDEEADDFIAQIADGPTVALRTSKRTVNKGFEQTIDQAMENEAAGQAAVFQTHDHEEGATAFLEGRAPEFTGE